ncbi:MAG: hypothetical protein IKV85_07470, partial [Ruminococcus sp.]|nr:hypothetical protein [Ruminococcus sp.]
MSGSVIILVVVNFVLVVDGLVLVAEIGLVAVVLMSGSVIILVVVNFVLVVDGLVLVAEIGLVA